MKNYKNIGIIATTQEKARKQFEEIVEQLPKNEISQIIYGGECKCIMKNGDYYISLAYDNKRDTFPRGFRFNKVYVDSEISLKIYHYIILPYLVGNDDDLQDYERINLF